MADDDENKDDQHDYAAPLLKLKSRSTLIRQVMLAFPSWITPNGVTVFRALLVLPAIALLVTFHYWPAIALLATAMFLDFVDGALATARSAQSELGAFLDPLADKIIICGSLLAIMSRMSWYFAAVTVCICAIAASLTLARMPRMIRASRGLKAPSMAASSAGKLKMVAETVGLLTALVALAIPASALSWIALAALLIALRYGASSLLSQIRA